MMKTLFITLLFLCHFLIPLKSYDRGISIENQQQYLLESELGEFFKELGTARKDITDGTFEVNVQIYRKLITERSQKSFREIKGENIYRYNIVCTSSSIYEGQLTSTWLFGLWIWVNQVPITQPIYPDGKDVMVYTTPTIVHTIETDEENPSIRIAWEKGVPDPKIIK